MGVTSGLLLGAKEVIIPYDRTLVWHYYVETTCRDPSVSKRLSIAGKVKLHMIETWKWNRMLSEFDQDHIG